MASPLLDQVCGRGLQTWFRMRYESYTLSLDLRALVESFRGATIYSLLTSAQKERVTSVP